MTEIAAAGYTSYLGNLTVTRRVLEAKGVDTKGLFKDINLDIAEYESNKFKRVPVSKADKFFQAAIERSGDACFGLTVADYINPATYQQFGVGLLYSHTLRDFLNRFARFFSFMTTLYKVSFEDPFGSAKLTLHPVVNLSEPTKQFDIDVFTAGVIKFLRLAHKPDYTPHKVNIGWNPPEEYHSRYEDIFKCAVNFGTDETSIEFDYYDLENKFPASNIELAQEHDKVVIDFLSKAAKVDLRYQIYSRLIEMLPTGECTREQIARSLNMSGGSLHSRLKKEGTNYQELLDETRKSLAQNYVSQADISLTEIAYMLGYTNSSNFSRAFKGWTGKTPRSYRLDVLSN